MKNIVKILCVIIIVSFVIILIWNMVYSKYFNSDETEVSSKIANPKIYVQMEKTIVDSLDENVISCEFSVKNYYETSSDISFDYYISFDVNDAPLLIRLYRINGDEEEQIALNEYKTVESEKIGLGEIEKFYRLELEYDKNSDNILEEDFKINICLQAIQEEVV